MSVGTGAALIGGAVIAGGATVAASAINSGAANNAAAAGIAGQNASIAAQTANANNAIAAFTTANQNAQKTLAPFQAAQVSALGQLQGLTDPNNPLYQQQRDVATNAIQRQLAAQGLLNSKKQSDLLTNLELGLANERVGIIGGIAGNGAAQNSAQLSQSLGSQIGSVYGNLGTGLGSSFSNIGQIGSQGAIAQGQAASGALTGLGNVAQGTIGNYLGYTNQQSQLAMLQRLLNGGGSATGAAPLSSQISQYNIGFGS